ncbi:MAG TPA: hypothetical protein VMU51_36650 [Mycobacteriales bacterium]|nr:hypothetical protein [Mycobacteriales bacterium]
MSMSRLSITMPPDVERVVRAAAERAGVPVSQWLARVAEHAAKSEDGLQAVAEYEADFGPLPAEADRRAQAILAAAGLLNKDSMRAAG